MKNKIIDVALKAIIAIAILLGFKVIIRDIPEEPEKEKIVFYSVDPDGANQKTDFFTVSNSDLDME